MSATQTLEIQAEYKKFWDSCKEQTVGQAIVDELFGSVSVRPNSAILAGFGGSAEPMPPNHNQPNLIIFSILRIFYSILKFEFFSEEDSRVTFRPHLD